MFNRALFLLVNLASITISFPCIAQENIDIKNIPQTEQPMRYRILQSAQTVFSTPTQPIPPFIMPEGSVESQVSGFTFPEPRQGVPGFIFPDLSIIDCTKIESESNDIHKQILELLTEDNLLNVYLTELQLYENCYEKHLYRQSFLRLLNEELGKQE